MHVCHYCANLSTTSLLANNTHNLSTAVPAYLSIPTNSNTTTNLPQNGTQSSSTQSSKSQQWNLGTKYTQNPNVQQYLSLLITPENTLPNNWEPTQIQPLISNIPSATISNDKSLPAIFPFELEKTILVSLFSGAILNTKLITAMYTNVKVDNYQVDCAASACIITANGATKTPISKINDLPIKIIQELQISQNGQHMQTPVICGYFKTNNISTSLIELEEEINKLLWEAYQVSWTDKDHIELLPILS
ncbi:hypothetical protein G9A89_022523 [Geosiphon pyriformis]|nr:hypothetical protein G9A89_022523 [Geosiphon pyriformis]